MLHLKKGPNHPGPILSTLPIYFVHIFLLNNYSLWAAIYIRPCFFIFATPFRDSHSRLPFATPIRDPRFTTPIATPYSRLMFATTLATHISDSRSRLHSRLPFATPNRAPNRDSLFFVANRILSKVQKSFLSCTHVNCCQNHILYINLQIFLNILS